MKIPPQAKRVFKGVIFDVYQWEQKMFDGSTQTFEMLKRPDTAVIIPVVGTEILMIKEEQPGHQRYVGFPGGRVDECEEELPAAKRELLEETGLESDDWELLASYEPYAKIEWTVYYYIARACRKVAEPKLDSGEKIEFNQISFEKFMEVIFQPGFYAGAEYMSQMWQVRQDAEKMKEFRKKLFPES